MGTEWFDQFSLLHGAVGIIMYFWGVSFWCWTLLHLLYEIVENTQIGMYIINQYITIWPGGKEFADYWINRGGDIISGSIGWLSAYMLDHYMGPLKKPKEIKS